MRATDGRQIVHCVSHGRTLCDAELTGEFIEPDAIGCIECVGMACLVMSLADFLNVTPSEARRRVLNAEDTVQQK